MQAFNEPSRSKFKYTTDLHLLLHQDTNFKYTQWVPCSSVQCMIHLFTVSLRACPNWTNDKEKKEPNPHVRKKQSTVIRDTATLRDKMQQTEKE